MKIAAIHQLIDTFAGAFEGLQADVPPHQLERLAVMIHKVMTGPSRIYHTPQHVFGLLDPADPLRLLAALFHDVVYYQVDGGFLPEVYETLAPYVQEKEGAVFLAAHVEPADRLWMMVLGLFGFQAGQELSIYAGLNECLSALVMARRLAGLLSESDLLKIAVCIEATIPFKGPNAQGQDRFEVLAGRLQAVNAAYGLSMTPADVRDAIQRAVIFANADVDSFSQADPGRFLDDAWKLLPETNAALRCGQVYSVRDFRRALQKVEGFYASLDPAHVFHAYQGVPPHDEFQRLLGLARHNLHTAREYLGVKLLAMAIFEALAELTGGDAPLALFMGDPEREGEGAKGLENFLPPAEHVAETVDTSSVVFRLLDQGRAGESSFDLRRSPTSLFLYTSLGPGRVAALLEEAKAMFDGQLAPRDFLAHVNAPVVPAIARACAEMVATRRQALLALAEE